MLKIIEIKNKTKFNKIKKGHSLLKSKTNIYIYKIIIITILILCFVLSHIKRKRKRNRTNRTNRTNITNRTNRTNRTFKKEYYHKGRIFDCFMYNNEADMAYVHIWRLYDYVDKFIIIVSNQTFTNLSKSVSFSPFEENIRQYKNKIDVAYFNNICNKNEYYSDNLIWCLENSQRDYAKTYIEEHYAPTEDDLIIIVDIDEIFTREGIEYVIKNPPKNYYHIKGAMYFPYYYHKVEDWDKGLVVRYKKKMRRTFSQLRLMVYDYNTFKYHNSFKPLITHCSFCYSELEKYRNKLISFSHQEFNKELYITNNWIFKSQYCREKIDSEAGYDEPYEGWRHLIPDDKRLKFLVDPSFMFPLNLTNYTEKDLETLCDKKYNRTPFE